MLVYLQYVATMCVAICLPLFICLSVQPVSNSCASVITCSRTLLGSFVWLAETLLVLPVYNMLRSLRECSNITGSHPAVLAWQLNGALL